MSEKKTIGLFIDTFFPMVDGVCMVVDNYARRLTKSANVIVFAPEYPGTKYDDSKLPYEVVRCKSIKMPIIDYALPIPKLDKEFKRKVKNIELDIVHIHSPFSIGKTGVKYAKKHNIPVVGTLHSQYKMDFLRAVKFNSVANILTKIIMKQYNNCDECWTVNEELARILKNEYGCKKEPKVIRNATDMEPIDNLDEAINTINTKHNISDKDKVFLFVGRINNLKNVFFIANSLKLLKEKADFNFKMLFVGTGQDEEKMKELINKNKMDKETIMCGKITDRNMLAQYYARADLFLFPSLYDSSSIVQIEAASQHTPTLFIENAVTAATIKNNVNGFTSKNNENSYADRIIEIINDKNQYKKVCDKAYKEVYINWEETVKNVYDNYLNLCLKNKKSKK